jgi:hypothetical protein
VTLGQFLLELDDKFSQHREAHIALRPGGKWASGTASPTTAEDWAQIETYMGLFERINILIEKNILDTGTIDRLYGYRVNNIVSNPKIRQAKLIDNADYWTDFLSLCSRLDIKIQ